MRPESPGGCSLITESGTYRNSLRCPSFDVARGPEVLPRVGLPARAADQASVLPPSARLCAHFYPFGCVLEGRVRAQAHSGLTPAPAAE